jgi:hypothetical protein
LHTEEESKDGPANSDNHSYTEQLAESSEKKIKFQEEQYKNFHTNNFIASDRLNKFIKNQNDKNPGMDPNPVAKIGAIFRSNLVRTRVALHSNHIKNTNGNLKDFIYKKDKYIFTELSDILNRASQCFEYSSTAINSFLGSHYFNNKNYTHEQLAYLRSKLLEKNPEELNKYWDARKVLYDNLKIRFKKNKSTVVDRLRTHQDIIEKISEEGGLANCFSQAIILRSFLVNEIKEDDLLAIGRNNIQVSSYKHIDHAFVVIKNLYDKPDLPKNHLVLDTWVKHLFLPKMAKHRESDVFPASKIYYSELLEGIKDEGISSILTVFNKENKCYIGENKGYIGPLEGYNKVLMDHADGVHIALDDMHVTGECGTIGRDYFNHAELRNNTHKLPGLESGDYVYITDDEYDLLYRNLLKLARLERRAT